MSYRMHGKDEKCVHSFNCEHLIGRYHYGCLGMDRIILKRTFKNIGVRMWIGFNWIRIVPSGAQLWTW
jgi:hypothetical protein